MLPCMSMQVGCSSSHNRCPMRPRRARKWRGLKSGQRNSGTARRRAGLGDRYSAEKTTEGLWWQARVQVRKGHPRLDHAIALHA
jgi:hypothetical protein